MDLENNGITIRLSKTQVYEIRVSIPPLAIYHNYYEKGGGGEGLQRSAYLLSDYMVAVELAVMHHPG